MGDRLLKRQDPVMVVDTYTRREKRQRNMGDYSFLYTHTLLHTGLS
jgi:hypothetical protein